MKHWGRLEIEVAKEHVAKGDPAWAITIWHMTPSFSGEGEDGSGNSFTPRFGTRYQAQWVAERIHAAYDSDGWNVKWRKPNRNRKGN